MSAILDTPVIDQSAPPLQAKREATIVVAGNPNAGKTSLFNSLTGLRQKVANYPGVTVESKMGQWTLSPELPPARLIDLPGLYSLAATSLDEEIARDILLGRGPTSMSADAIVVVVDATNMVRNLYLAMQLIETKQPIIIALTMFDLAERSNLKIDVEKLSDLLGVPVVPVVAKQRRGLEDLAKAVRSTIDRGRATSVVPLADGKDDHERQSKLIKRYALIERIVSDAVDATNEGKHSVSERIDRVVTHKIFGPLVLIVVMLLVFQAIFSWASLPMNLIDNVFSALGDAVRTHLPAGIFTDLLTDGIIAGVGGVLAFLPQILLLFLFISILEDSGYMARAAFLMDRLMRAVGLHGKAFVPFQFKNRWNPDVHRTTTAVVTAIAVDTVKRILLAQVVSKIGVTRCAWVEPSSRHPTTCREHGQGIDCRWLVCSQVQSPLSRCHGGSQTCARCPSQLWLPF